VRLAVLALALLAQAPEHPEAPGPRIAIAGLGGFRSTSRFDFGGEVNRLTALYLFPDRARWTFENYAAPGARQTIYRLGARVHQDTSGEPSEALENGARDTALLQMELRRAAMLWPDGFDWERTDDGSQRATVYADPCCKRAPVGALVASAPVDERTTRFEARTADGEVVEALEVRERQELHGRSWPRTLVLRPPGAEIVETVEAIEVQLHYLDVAFLPCDRRPLTRTPSGPSVLSSDLVPVTFRASDLAPGLSWEAALAQADARIAEAGASLRELGLAVDPVPTFELGPDGKPARCLVRLQTAQAPPPAGFQTVGERPGLSCRVETLTQVDRALLEGLVRARPDSTAPGTPYLRCRREGKDVRQIDLVLPLQAPR